jgi:hypothetical protein
MLHVIIYLTLIFYYLYFLKNINILKSHNYAQSYQLVKKRLDSQTLEKHVSSRKTGVLSVNQTVRTWGLPTGRPHCFKVIMRIHNHPLSR